ncbi:MAG: hypothetical protein DME21_14930 [Verrucomicrobia bacterium]|nr:MAG: hypothetical protein DME21_14930 [Verrucomicrobiota bacterium]
MQHAREHPAIKHRRTEARSDLDALRQRRDRSHYLTRLVVKTGDKVVILKTGDIDAIESAGNYVAVQFGKESHILRGTLSALEAQLDPKKFLRISRSAIVNLDHVKELLPMSKGEQAIVLHNGKHFAMTLDLREAERALRFS